MSCDPKSFSNVDANVFEGLMARLRDAGYEVPGIEGSILGPMGIVIDFHWDEGSATLHTHVKEKNFFVPCSRINAELQKAIDACRR